MLKTLLSNFYPISCSKYYNRELVGGDLLFYRAGSILEYISNFIGGISAVSAEPVYHVAMIVESHANNITIVQASSAYGVVISSYDDICAAEGIFNTIEVRRVNIGQSVVSRAVELALQHTGEPYNDIFSPDYINSKGEHSFYCSQLIQFAYNEAAGREIFSSHPMWFPLPDGQVSAYWQQYFEKLHSEVPVGVNGSHPGIMYESDFLIDLI